MSASGTWCGAVPPLGVAVQVMVVLTGCGAVRLAVSATVAGVVIAKRTDVVLSAASAVLTALRTHTPTVALLLATVGVHANVFDVVHVPANAHVVPSKVSQRY